MQNEKIKAAYVMNPLAPGAMDKIYGLTVLERTLHALARGGVDAIFLPGGSSARMAAIVLGGRIDADIHFSENILAELPPNVDGLLVVEAPLVFDPKVTQVFFEINKTGTAVHVLPKKEMAYMPAQALAKLKAKELPEKKGLAAWLHAAREEGISIEETDFPGLLCMPIRTAEDKTTVKKALIRNLVKPTDGWVSKNLNRPISTSISRILAHTSITPNQFTVLTGLFGLATGVFAAMGGYWNFLMAGALFHLTSILDGVDGELARLKFQSSPFGQWLDTLVDNLSYIAGLAGIVIGIYRTGASDAVKIAAVLSVVFVVLALGSLYLYLLRFKSGGTLLNVKYSFQDANGWAARIMQTAAAFGKRDLFALVFFLLAIVGQLPMALGYIAIMAFFVFAFSLQAHYAAAKMRRMT